MCHPALGFSHSVLCGYFIVCPDASVLSSLPSVPQHLILTQHLPYLLERAKRQKEGRKGTEEAGLVQTARWRCLSNGGFCCNGMIYIWVVQQNQFALRLVGDTKWDGQGNKTNEQERIHVD